jgi:PAS domain S-box-containing protein
VLVVDDSEDDARIAQREVRRGGYELVSVRVDTREALEAELDAPWDIILCDYHIPSLDAPAVLGILRERRVEVPCIIVSGTVGEDTAVDAMRLGARDYLTKGNLRRLVPAIERELREVEVRRERARAREALRRTEASVRSLVESLPDGVLVHRDGAVVYANATIAALVGEADGAVLVGRSVASLVGSGTLDAESPLVRAEGGRRLGEEKLRRRDGTTIDVDVTATRIVFDGAQSVLAVIREASLRREVTAKMVEIDRMIAVGTLAAGVGHEINNPLAYVLANVEFVQGELDGVRALLLPAAGGAALDAPEVANVCARLAESKDVLSEATEGGLRIRDIVQDLRTFSRDEQQVGPIDVRPVLESALRMAANEARHRARVVRDYQDVPNVAANPSRLGQVFLNLVVNAAQAIRGGTSEENEIRVTVRPDGEDVVVEIADTGVGIREEDLPRVFTPFFTTKPIGEGTGLGLAICRTIVTGLGGRIEVETRVGKGSCFRVTLPVSRSEVERRPRPSVTRFARVARILFVDDEDMLRDAVKRFFEREHEVVAARGGEQALDLLESGKRFDVLFVDVMMPKMTGVELFDRISARWPQLASRVVFMTGGAVAPDVRARVERAPNRRVDKPFDMAELRALVAALIG